MIRFSKVRDVKSPVRGTEGSAGIDFFVPEGPREIPLAPNQWVLIPSGIKAQVPAGHMLVAMNKSGICMNMNLITGACVIDEDYQGEIYIHVGNMGKDMQYIKPGMKIVQFILVPVLYARPVEVPESELFAEATARGEGGFGSTGLE